MSKIDQMILDAEAEIAACRKVVDEQNYRIDAYRGRIDMLYLQKAREERDKLT